MIPGIGRVKFNQLETHFGSLQDAWKAGQAELSHAGLDGKSVRAINECRPRISLEAEMEKLERYGIEVLAWHDSTYPARLKEIYDYPPVLYIRGSIIDEDEWCLAVVGTRRPTVYGRQVTEEVVAELARSKITIVSGLARGIDSVAHRSALEAGGRSIAVMGGGLDSIYPAENAGLARSITEKGALFSEYHPGTKPRPENFPRRNRIMSGMSLGVLVVEAGNTSGALITAHLALERIVETRRLVEQTTRQIREMGLMLRPGILDDVGLVPALRWYTNWFAKQYEMATRFRHRGMGDRLRKELETTFYRIVQEAFTNIIRHAQAQNVSVYIERLHESVVLLVADDGVGFDAATFLSNPRGESFGLLGMQERAKLIGGTIDIHSQPGRGTRLSVEIPLKRG